MLDFLLVSRRHHKISQSAETLPGEFFLGEARLYQLRRDHKSDLRAGFLHAALFLCMEEEAKYLWYPPHWCLLCNCILEEFKQGGKGKAAENKCVSCADQLSPLSALSPYTPQSITGRTLWAWPASFLSERLPPEDTEPVSICLTAGPWGLQRCSDKSTF